MNTQLHSPTFDPASAEFRQNPYPVYREFRRLGPVVYRPDQDDWIVTGYDAVRQWLTGPRLEKHQQAAPAHGTTLASGSRGELNSGMIAQELRQAVSYHFDHAVQKTAPPYHTHLRKIIGDYFSKDYFARLKPILHQAAAELLEQAAKKQPLDITEDFAFPFTATVICHMLGLPFADRFKLREWSYSYQRSMNLPIVQKDQLRRNMALLGMASYLRQHILDRVDHPGTDFISYLTRCHLESQLSYDALVGNIMTLVLGGFENTQNGIGLAVHGLLQHPEQMALLRESPELLPATVEECLRYDPPVQCFYTDHYDGDIGGQAVRRGQRIHLIFGAANRDPDVFAEPDIFDISSKRKPHLAFGAGIHYCLGAYLARMEMEMAIEVLMQTFPRLTLHGHGLVLSGLYNVRGVKHVWVAT